MLGETRWRAIGRGIIVGTLAALLLTGLIALLRLFVDGFAESDAERTVALLAIPCYIVAGFHAVSPSTTSPSTDGALGGAGVGIVGLVISAVLWSLQVRDVPDHLSVVLSGPLLFGAAFGALGGALARRRRAVIRSST